MISGKMYRFRVSQENMEPRYVEAYLRTSAAQAAIDKMKTGGSDSGLNLTHDRFKQLQLPVAPFPEQRRIVDEIEKQFTRLDDAVAALKRVQANLKRYRASVLKAACEGRLVPTEAELARKERRDYEPASELLKRIFAERRAKWEADQLQKMIAADKPPKDDEWKAKYKPAVPPDEPELTELPDGWTWASLDQLSWASDYGTSEKCDYGSSGIPVLRIPNIDAGRIDLSDLKRTTKTKSFTTSESVSVGDILIIRTNGSRDLIGRAAVVAQPLDEPYLHASYLIRFRLLRYFRWLGLVWDTPAHRSRIEANAATSAGQYNVSMGELARLPIPLPPAREAVRICEELERRLSGVEAALHAAEQQLRHADTLRSSILKKAFCGKLVPQDPNDEPAYMLLERIRAERAPAQQPKEKTPKATNGASPANGQRRRRVKELAQRVSAGKG